MNKRLRPPQHSKPRVIALAAVRSQVHPGLYAALAAVSCLYALMI